MYFENIKFEFDLNSVGNPNDSALKVRLEALSGFANGFVHPEGELTECARLAAQNTVGDGQSEFGRLIPKNRRE